MIRHASICTITPHRGPCSEMVHVKMSFPPPEKELAGKGLARCLTSARFQPLPIGTVHEVFPHTARPAVFTEKGYESCGTDSRFHV